MAIRWWENLDGPILGRYRIERLLGEGGMARVFLAMDVRSNRPVAFKTPKLEAFPQESLKELLSRFNREFDSQAADPVQGVIPIYESGEFTDADGVVRPFLAMQYLSGGSLGDLLGGTIGRRARTQTLAEVLDWVVPIARTLDRLHARRYLHRDVKPDNILFNSDGDPFLADLGIVGSLDNTLGGSTMAATGLGVLASPGSPGYQSPESIQADPVMRNVSASDQFSLAVTVYEALAACLPVKAGTNQEWYGALMHWAPTPLFTHCPDMPPAASDAVMKAMSTQASGRFTTCSEFAKALAAAVMAHRVAAPPPVQPAAASATPPRPTPAPPPRAAAAPATPAAPVPPRKPMSMLNKARIGAAIIAVVVLSLGWKLGWMDAGKESTGTLIGPGVDSNGDPLRRTEPGSSRTAWTASFDFDKTEPTLASLLAIDEAAAFLRRTPDARLLITGHADPTEGSAAYAMGVSQQRADSVREYLVLHGIDGARLRTESRGGAQPLVPSVLSDGSTDRAAVARNRRVELVLDTAPAANDAGSAATPTDATATTADADAAATDTPAAAPEKCDEFGPDDDGDAVADCLDKCAASAADELIGENGCGRPHDPKSLRVVFAPNSSDLGQAQRAKLDRAAAYYQAHAELLVNLSGNADISEGKNRVIGDKLRLRRAEAVRDYLVAKGIGSDRLLPNADVDASGNEQNADGSLNPRGTARRRRVALFAFPLPQAWAACIVFAPGADRKTMYYTYSEVINAGLIGSFLGGNANNSPSVVTILKAAGANPNASRVECSLPQKTPEAGDAEFERTLKAFQQKNSSTPLVRLEGKWEIEGARSRP